MPYISNYNNYNYYINSCNYCYYIDDGRHIKWWQEPIAAIAVKERQCFQGLWDECENT